MDNRGWLILMGREEGPLFIVERLFLGGAPIPGKARMAERNP
jgi:hypothetical protein